eukprot:Rhum_TRINITY_DN15101_c6_g1::Rhum_TRINITY_DN15101_c6_g1_i1::g.139352::m.139352
MMQNLSKRAAARGILSQQSRALTYTPPAKEINFVFNDVINLPKHYEENCPPHVKEECTQEFMDDLISASGQLAQETLLPLYQTGDVGCIWKNGDVSTPAGFKEAFDTYREGGWNALTYPTKYGGMGLPLSASLVKNEICATGNWSWFMYPGLSLGACNTIINHCTEEIKEKYLPRLVDLTWAGTMCLTEPGCGTDLGQMTTKAVPTGDGSYKITGNKIFISGGEQDLTENILHICLAKLPDAPKGTKGISLFLVPKYQVNDDGSLDTSKKNVECAGIEKKMGIHGCSTAQLAFDDSIGYLIGEPHDGLRQMFTFMNTARVGTGIQGLAHMELAFQNAVTYCNERTSLRALSGTKAPEKAGDPIIHHGDVRRILNTAKCLLEGSRCLLYDVARYGDRIAYAEEAGDHELAKKLDDEMGFLTPIAKGCVTEWSNQVANMCMDTYGGHGYIKDHGMEQIVRDAKIATLYEGTTGIQALDMLGRKMMIDKLRLFRKWNKIIRNSAWDVSVSSTNFKMQGMKLYKMAWEWHKDVLAISLRASKNRDAVGTASHDHLFNSGYIFLGYYWLRMGTTAEKALEKRSELSETDIKFYESKIASARFYFTHVINRAAAHRINMTKSPTDFYTIPNDGFTFL